MYGKSKNMNDTTSLTMRSAAESTTHLKYTIRTSCGVDAADVGALDEVLVLAGAQTPVQTATRKEQEPTRGAT